MSWQRIIRLNKKKNFYFHFTIESYDNMGLVTTLKKDGQDLILECSTPLSNSKFYDKVIENILREIKEQ
jgi:hypothetical protein